MNLRRIRYGELNGKQKETYNFQKVAAVLADYGYNCIKLNDDWKGADFLAYHKDGKHTLKVQLKTRITIMKQYLNKRLYMTFRVHNKWYLIQHDKLVEIIGEVTNWLNTPSWTEKGLYHSSSPSKLLLKKISKFVLE